MEVVIPDNMAWILYVIIYFIIGLVVARIAYGINNGFKERPNFATYTFLPLCWPILLFIGIAIFLMNLFSLSMGDE